MHGFHLDSRVDCTLAKLRGDQAEAREMEVLARLAAATPCTGRHNELDRHGRWAITYTVFLAHDATRT